MTGALLSDHGLSFVWTLRMNRFDIGLAPLQRQVSLGRQVILGIACRKGQKSQKMPRDIIISERGLDAAVARREQ